MAAEIAARTARPAQPLPSEPLGAGHAGAIKEFEEKTPNPIVLQ
jgi:hypothetical protein